MSKRTILVIVGLITAFPVFAEPGACRDPDYDHFGLSAAQLRQIASQCTNESVARLFYNRAYHLDLVHRAQAQSDLIGYSPQHGQYLITPQRVRQVRTYRLYMTFIEQLAPGWFADMEEKVAFLNSEYDRHGELAELRLKGYDHLADFKEREARQRRDN